MFACMVCGEPPGTESEMSEVIVTIDRPIELGLREPRTGIVHEQCLAEGETQALEEGLNWTVGGRWTQRGLVTLDETASRKPGVCAICDRELDPPIVLTGVGFVCRRCVSDLVTSFFARLDEVDPSGRRRVPLVPGTAQSLRAGSHRSLAGSFLPEAIRMTTLHRNQRSYRARPCPAIRRMGSV